MRLTRSLLLKKQKILKKNRQAIFEISQFIARYTPKSSPYKPVFSFPKDEEFENLQSSIVFDKDLSASQKFQLLINKYVNPGRAPYEVNVSSSCRLKLTMLGNVPEKLERTEKDHGWNVVFQGLLLGLRPLLNNSLVRWKRTEEYREVIKPLLIVANVVSTTRSSGNDSETMEIVFE